MSYVLCVRLSLRSTSYFWGAKIFKFNVDSLVRTYVYFKEIISSLVCTFASPTTWERPRSGESSIGGSVKTVRSCC